MKIKRNAIRSKSCSDIIESKSRHDFVRCSCGSVFVDGGLDYCRYGCPSHPASDWIEFLAEYEEDK